MSYFKGSVEHFWDNYNKGKKMETAQTLGFNTEFNGDKIKAALEAATITERHQGREREVVEPGDVGSATATVQTDADINP